MQDTEQSESRALQWQEKVVDYDCEILYKPGKENVVADALSRVRKKLRCPLPTKNFRQQVIGGYKDSPLGNFIKAVEEKKETMDKYTIDGGLLRIPHR